MPASPILTPDFLTETNYYNGLENQKDVDSFFPPSMSNEENHRWLNIIKMAVIVSLSILQIEVEIWALQYPITNILQLLSTCEMANYKWKDTSVQV